MYTTLKSLAWLFIFCLLLVVAFFSLLHTKYAQPTLNPLLQQLSDQRLSFGGLSYSITDPLHLTLSEVSIKSEQNMTFDTLDIWLSQRPIQRSKIALDSVKIDGVSLQNGLPDTTELSWLSISQFNVSNLDFAYDGLVIRDAQVQISNWAQKPDNRIPFKGNFQFSTEQVYWQGEALDDVLIDGYYSPDYTALHGISFIWRDSTITAQAELKDNTLWMIPQFTLRNFNLESNNADIIGKPLEWLKEKQFTYQFERIDLLDINIELPQFVVNNLSLSAENLLFPYELWQQTDAYISFNADSLVWEDTVIEKPIIDFTLNKKELNINNLSLDVFDGNIQLAGRLSPTDIDLTSLTLSQIKWFMSQQDGARALAYLNQLESVKIDTVDINNVQLVHIENQYPFQLSGLNAEGSNIDLLRNQQWALWGGTVNLSASNASFNYLLSQQLLIETHTTEGLWTIDRALLPLSEGLLGFNGHINLEQDSQPWQLEAYGDGLPIGFFMTTLPISIPLEGMAEFTFSGKGLAANRDSFNYSFDGQLNLIPREVTTTVTGEELWINTLNLTPDNDTPQEFIDPDIASDLGKKVHNVDIGTINVSANRGRISINPIVIQDDEFRYTISGDYDLVNPKQVETQVALGKGCHELIKKLSSEDITMVNHCQ